MQVRNLLLHYGFVAQKVEHRSEEPGVGGPNPPETIIFLAEW